MMSFLAMAHILQRFLPEKLYQFDANPINWSEQRFVRQL